MCVCVPYLVGARAVRDGKVWRDTFFFLFARLCFPRVSWASSWGISTVLLPWCNHKLTCADPKYESGGLTLGAADAGVLAASIPNKEHRNRTQILHTAPKRRSGPLCELWVCTHPTCAGPRWESGGMTLGEADAGPRGCSCTAEAGWRPLVCTQFGRQC